MDTGVISRGAERPESDVDHSPPIIAEVKNEWNCTSNPSVCLNDMGTDNFIIIIIYLTANGLSPGGSGY
jgi:hypothetical protein